MDAAAGEAGVRGLHAQQTNGMRRGTRLGENVARRNAPTKSKQLDAPVGDAPVAAAAAAAATSRLQATPTATLAFFPTQCTLVRVHGSKDSTVGRRFVTHRAEKLMQVIARMGGQQ